MFILLFIILLIQFFTYWVFQPMTSFLQYFLEIRSFPYILLISFIFLFSARNFEKM